VWCFWSVKGGAGCSVVSAGVALLLARRQPSLLVDLAGDLPAVLGVEPPAGPGIAQWLDAAHPPPDAISRIEVDAGPRLSLLPVGAGTAATTGAAIGADRGHDALDRAAERRADRLSLLARLLATDGRAVVVDAGAGFGHCRPLLDAADRSILVTRACYLAISRAAGERCPDGIVVVREPGRALRAGDIEAALGSPVVATVPWDPAVARAVDAGLLARRLPRALRPLQVVAGPVAERHS
jgi:cellulose biosynthesis protein BcsQ